MFNEVVTTGIINNYDTVKSHNLMERIDDRQLQGSRFIIKGITGINKNLKITLFSARYL